MTGATITMSANKRTLWENTRVNLPVVGEMNAFQAMQFIAESCTTMIADSYEVALPKIRFTFRQRHTAKTTTADNIHFEYGGLFHIPDSSTRRTAHISMNYKFNDLTELATNDLTTEKGQYLLKGIMTMMCHELIHAKQWAAGELKATMDGDFTWNGETVCIDTPYMEQPHEIEAHEGDDFYAGHMMNWIMTNQ